MEIIEIKNIVKKESLIHYINKYDCVLVYKINNKTAEENVHIILEKTAIGTTDIQLDHDDVALGSNENILRKYIAEQIKHGVFV